MNGTTQMNGILKEMKGFKYTKTGEVENLSMILLQILSIL
jgi:hypothetical protein